jgi:hypothetical protein
MKIRVILSNPWKSFKAWRWSRQNWRRFKADQARIAAAHKELESAPDQADLRKRWADYEAARTAEQKELSHKNPWELRK